MIINEIQRVWMQEVISGIATETPAEEKNRIIFKVVIEEGKSNNNLKSRKVEKF